MQSNNQTAAIKNSQHKHLNVLGHSIIAKLTSENTGGNYYVFECISSPGLGIPLNINRQGDAIVTVIEGEYSIMIGNNRFDARKGDSYFFPRQVPHSFQSTGTKAGTTLWMITRCKNMEEFFNAMNNIPAGDPDPMTIARIFAEHEMEIIIPKQV